MLLSVNRVAVIRGYWIDADQAAKMGRVDDVIKRLKKQVAHQRASAERERTKTEDLVVQAYDNGNGMTIRAIATQSGLSHEGVRKMLKRRGIDTGDS